MTERLKWVQMGVMLLILGAVGLLLIRPDFPASAAPVQAAGQEEEPPFLQVAGEGKVKVKPDVAYLSVGIETQGATAQVAQERNAGKVQAVIDQLAALGIGKDEVETSGFNLYPEYDYSGKGAPRLTGYRASNQLRVTIDDLNAIGRVADAVVKAGVTNLNGVNFDLKDPAEARRQALARAVADGKAEADAMARAAGVTLTGLRALVEGTAGGPVPIMRRMHMDYAASEPAEGPAPTPVLPGDLTVTAHVSMTFSIRP